MMDAWTAGLYVIILIVAGLGYRYLAGLPQRFHDEGLERFRHELDEKLEEVRASLMKEIELTKITHGELQVRKTEEFIRLSEFYREILADPQMVDEAERDPKARKKLQKRVLDSAVRLFFFASDETIEAYRRWWTTALQAEQGDEAAVRLLKRFAELNLCMRRDLGYDETEATSDDFLAMLLTDWEEYKEQVAGG